MGKKQMKLDSKHSASKPKKICSTLERKAQFTELLTGIENYLDKENLNDILSELIAALYKNKPTNPVIIFILVYFKCL